MTQYLSYATGPLFLVLLLISSIAVLLLLFSTFKKKIPKAVVQKIELSTKLVGALTAVVSLLLSGIGVFVPLGPVTKDDAKTALNQYFNFLQTRHLESAYDLVSEARKKERRRNLPSDADDFAQYSASFVGTRGYENLTISFLGATSSERRYAVAYDVKDELPRSKLFELRKQLFSSKSIAEIVDRENVAKLIVGNLKEYYIVPDETVPIIRNYLDTRTLDDLVDPVFVPSIAADLRDTRKLVLAPNPNHPNFATIKRHFIHEVIVMIMEGGAWKIRSGLNIPVIAVY